jgi:hypothetical protein
VLPVDTKAATERQQQQRGEEKTQTEKAKTGIPVIASREKSIRRRR